MFDKLKDMGNLVKQAKEMRGQMKAIQDELKNVVVEGDALGGKVRIKMTCEFEVTETHIDDSLLSPNESETLKKGLKQAYNSAAQIAKKEASGRLSKISGGLDLPGF